MEVITIDVAVYSWLIFWFTYWIFGSFLSWKTHINGIRKVKDLGEVVSVVVTNMLWTLFAIILLYLCPLRAWTDAHVVVKLFLTYIFTDIWFYHFHIMIHHPQLYKKIHKLHHHEKMKEPYALTALYCTPYEAMFLNVFSTSFGPVIFQLPPPYLYIWYFLIAINSVATHSGITIPYILDGNHDRHHQNYNSNYGLSIYFDWIYGTYSISNKLEHETFIDGKCLGNFPIDSSKLD